MFRNLNGVANGIKVFCSIGYHYIADTDLEILAHTLLVNYVLLIIQETTFTAPQDHIMMKLGRKLWRSLG